MGQLYALLTVHVLEHIDGLIAASPVVGLLIFGELGGILHPLDDFEEVVRLTGTITTVGFIGERLELRGQLFSCPMVGGACCQQQERQNHDTSDFIHKVFLLLSSDISSFLFILSQFHLVHHDVVVGCKIIELLLIE